MLEELQRCALMLVCIALTAPVASACTESDEAWPQWRGPELTGASRSAKPPLTWGEERNVAWKRALPSWAGSSPIVSGERVFVTSPSAPQAEADGDVARVLPNMTRRNPGGPDLLLLCFDRRDGKPVWEYRLDDGNRLFGKQNLSSPSPVTDGKTVWVLSGTGVLAAVDFGGKELWRKDLASEWGAFLPAWGYASSPVLWKDRILIQVLQASGESYLAALDAVSGKVLWKEGRKTDAQRECPDAYTTPTIARTPQGDQVIVVGANYVTGHDPQTGRELWRGGGLNPQLAGNYRIVPSPVVVADLVISPTRVKPMLAYRLGGTGDVTGSHLAWKYEGKGAPDVPSPVTDGTRVYLVDDRGVVVCLKASTGEVLWGPERTADGTVSASPVLADGRVYITNEIATTTVLAAGDAFNVLATNTLDDGYTISTPAPAGADLFIRTSAHLYCIRHLPGN